MKQALVGGTVADVYTGTWVDANVEFEDGVITYVGPREPACAAIDISGKVLVPGYIEPHTHPWCLYSPTSLLEVAVPDGTTTLVYDNLFFFLSHGVDGLRTIVDAMRAAPAHIRWVARIAPQSAYPDEAERFAIDTIAPMLSWPEVVASGEITNWMSVARGEPRVAAGIAAAKAARRRVEGHNAGASYDRLNELSLAGISADHEAITARRRWTGCGWGCGRCCASPRCGRTSRSCSTGSTTVIGSARRLMFTTDGADAVVLRRARRDRRRAADRDRARRGPDARAADGDDRPGDVPRARRGAGRDRAGARGDASTCCPRSGSGGRRPSTSGGEVVARDGRLVAARRRCRGPRARAGGAGAGLFAPLTGTQPVARYESAVINRRVDREVAPGDVHAVLVGRDGSWAAKGVVERFLDVDGFATTATTSLELLVVGRDPAAMARAAARVAEMGGGFAFDGGWSAPLEIDGLISSGRSTQQLRSIVAV